MAQSVRDFLMSIEKRLDAYDSDKSALFLRGVALRMTYRYIFNSLLQLNSKSKAIGGLLSFQIGKTLACESAMLHGDWNFIGEVGPEPKFAAHEWNEESARHRLVIGDCVDLFFRTNNRSRTSLLNYVHLFGGEFFAELQLDWENFQADPDSFYMQPIHSVGNTKLSSIWLKPTNREETVEHVEKRIDFLQTLGEAKFAGNRLGRLLVLRGLQLFLPTMDLEDGLDHDDLAVTELTNIARNPLGEDEISRDNHGIWHLAGKSEIDDSILEDARDRVADEIALVRKALEGPKGNSLAPICDALDLLSARLDRYPNRALRLHDTFLQVERRITRDLEDGELVEDHIVSDLRTALSTAALDMHNACSQTRDVVQARLNTRLGDADPEVRQQLKIVAEAAGKVSSDELAIELIEDAEVVASDSAADEATKPERYRLIVRLARIVTQGGKNVFEALKELGAVGGGIATFSAMLMIILQFLL